MLLTAEDLGAALDVLDAMHSADGLGRLPSVLAAALAKAISYEFLIWSDVHVGGRHGLDVQLTGFPAGIWLPGAEPLRGYLLSHPGAAHQLPAGGGPPLRWSDDLTLAQHRAVPHYSEVIAPLGAEHGATLSFCLSPERVVCITMARSLRDFSGRDLAVLSALWPRLTRRAAMLARRSHDRGLLTRREGDILALVATGLTSYQIARRLEVSQRTVEKHVEHILLKLNVPSRAAAAVRWADIGQGSQEHDDDG